MLLIYATYILVILFMAWVCGNVMKSRGICPVFRQLFYLIIFGLTVAFFALTI